MKKNLLVVSNHNPENWPDQQIFGWDRIDYIAFPNIPATATFNDVADIVSPICEQIGEWVANNPFGKLCIQGEFTATYIMQSSIAYCNDSALFTFPTTERVVEEKVNADGSISKTANFKFVQWR